MRHVGRPRSAGAGDLFILLLSYRADGHINNLQVAALGRQQTSELPKVADPA